MSHVPSLFRQTNELAATLAQIAENDGELTPELEASLTLNQQNLAGRAEYLLDLKAVAGANIALAKDKIKQLTDFIQANERITDQLDNRLLGAVHLFGPIQTSTQKLTLRPSKAVIIEDETLIPTEYRKAVVIPTQGAPDKAALKKRLEQGHTVPGAYLDHRYNLSIR